MVKNALLTLSLLLAAIVAQAVPVSEMEARSNVLQFLNSKGRQKIKGTRSLTLAHTIYQRAEKQVDESPMLYIYNVNGDQGFVVASADDVALPILAYSNEGGFSKDNIPDNVQAWLQGYADQIAAARAGGASLQKVVQPSKANKNSEGQAKPSAISANARKDIWSLLTTYWDQGFPFNLQCNFDGTQCKTGCVATALAQLLYYWATMGKDGKTFRGGCTSLIGYHNKDFYVAPLEAIDTFDWDNMRTRYWDSEEGEEGEEELAVAQLMRYCGQSVNMSYGVYESSASTIDVVDALFCNFHCFSNIQLIHNDDMSDEEWEGLIYNELANDRPVYMEGSGKGCHAFLCDGYDSELNTFHFNWGWGGGEDGYYAMNALKLGEMEFEDEVSYLYDFSNHKSAIININPLVEEPEPTRYVVLSDDSTTMTFYYDSEYGIRKGHLLSPYEANYLSWPIKENLILNIDKSFADYYPTDIYWFGYYVNLVPEISGIQFLNTERLTDMHRMFSGAHVASLDLSSFDTSKAKDMSEMFLGCQYLEHLDLSSFDTSNVVDMEEMFSCCYNLQSLDISSFVFSETTNTKKMFEYCRKLKSISIPATAIYLADDAFTDVGSSEPCLISAPENFDFGVDTSWGSFMWKGGRFILDNPSYIMPGDVNHDGMVSVLDITMMVDYILNPTSMNDDFFFENADLNWDNKITIIDIEKVVSLILNP